jgi:PKD repeat protein
MLVTGLFLLTMVAPANMAADVHEPITGMSAVTDDPDATAPTDGDQSTSDVAMDDFGRSHVVWQDHRGGKWAIMYARSDDGGRSFGPSIRINQMAPSIDYMAPSIDVDPEGNPYIVWHDPRNSGTTGLDIYLARSFDGGDTFGPNVRIDTGTSSRPETAADIAVGSNGKVFVVYVAGSSSSPDIFLSTSNDGGRTFGPSTLVNDDSGNNWQNDPVVVADSTNVAHMAWTDMRNGDRDIYYATQNAQGIMTSNVKVNGDTSGTQQEDPAMALDANTPILVWMDMRNGDADIYLAKRSSPTAFGANRLVNDDDTTTSQLEPDIAIASQGAGGGDPDVHVVWEGVESGANDIYLANSTNGGLSFGKEVQVNTDAQTGAIQNLPAIATGDVDGPLVITWDDGGDPARNRDVLASWRDPSVARPQVLVSDDRAKAFEAYPVTAVGPSGKMHSIWIDDRNGPYGVFYSYSINKGNAWGAVTKVDPSQGSDDQLAPDVAIGPDGTVHVAWTDYRGDQPEVRYANNKDKASGFNPSVRVDDAPAGAFAVSPSIGVAANGSATVAWLDGRDGAARCRITYSLNGGTSWRSSIEVPGSDTISTRSPPDLAMREGLVVVGFADDTGGKAEAYISMGSSVPELGEPIVVEAVPLDGPARSVRIAVDAALDGPVHVSWSKGVVLLSTYDMVEAAFSDPNALLEDTSGGPHIHQAIAAGDGGAIHVSWLDLEGGGTKAMLRTMVPGLDPPTLSQIQTNGPLSMPSVAFNAHQLSCILVQNALADPEVVCGVWENTPPDVPVAQSPANGGWVTTPDFNLTVGVGTDPDGDPVLTRFELTEPGGEVSDRPYSIDPRFSVTDAVEGTYSWMAYTTDSFGAQSTQLWTFTVDMTPPDIPEFHPVPQFTAGNTITLSWDPVTDPGGSSVTYRVHANQDATFTQPNLDDSGWKSATNHTFEDLPATLVHYRLFVRDEAGNTVEATQTASSTQDDEAPKVFISVEPALEAEEGEEVTFDATDSTDDNGIDTYGWDFDSDGTVDSTDASTSFIYTDAGEYSVTITITDLAGNAAEFSDYTITILDISPPTIELDVDPGLEVDEGTTVTFDATGTVDPSGIQVVRWFLDGEGVPFTTGYVAQMTFSEPGRHEVEMEAVDEWENVANRTVVITVLDVTPPVVTFTDIGTLDNTKVEFFTIFVNVTDSGQVETVVLLYKTQDAGVFAEVAMTKSPGTGNQWFKDELAPGPKGNATYYVRATDATGNENKTSYQRIQIIGVEDPKPPGSNGGDGFDIMDYLWLIIILVVVVVVAVAVSSRRKTKDKTTSTKKPGKAPAAPATEKAAASVASTSTTSQIVAAERKPAKDRALCAVEEVYFIHNDGRLILAASSSAAADRDAQDVFAGMFTAIQDFIKDSMSRKGSLGSFDYGDNRIIIERGPHITCAVTIFGTEPGAFRGEIREMVRQVEGNYAGVIERWDGDKAKLGGITEFAKRILGLTGGIDRETVIKATEKKGVKLLSEVEFFQGFVRLKTAVKNDTETVITDAALDIVYDDNVLRLDHIQPVYEYKRGKVHLGNINAGEKKTVAFNYDPVICMESNVDGNLTFRDVKGNLQVVSMKTRRADIVCPIFFTRENANTAMLKRLVKEELASQDSKVFRYPDGLAPNQAFELCKGVVHLHDVKFVREFFEDRPNWLGEAWFYGETKVKGYKIVIRVTVREESHTAEFYVASQEMEVITGLLAELGHSLNRMLKEKYMGRLKAQPIVDQKLKQELTDKPLLIEREP